MLLPWGKIAVVNRSSTPLDAKADLLVQGSIGETFSALAI